MLCGCVTAGRKALYAEALNAFKEWVVLCDAVQLLVVQLQAERQTLYAEAQNAFKRVELFWIALCGSVTSGGKTDLVCGGPECIQKSELFWIALCGSVTAGIKTGLVHKGPECVQRVSVVLSCAVLCCVVMYLQAERQACYM